MVTLTEGFAGGALAAALYLAAYLSFVRILRYPRNWVRPSLAVSTPAALIALAMLAFVSATPVGGIDAVTFTAMAGFVGALFYMIAAPAIAFRPASRLMEFLARHSSHAGLWLIGPALMCAFLLPDPRVQALIAAAMSVELAWFVRRKRADARRRLVTIEGEDLIVLDTQANGDIKQFASHNGIGELVVSGETVSWLGCHRETSPCPFNRYVNRLGLNTAPCCRERMREVCHAVDRWLDEMGLVHWLEGGTLLGAVRENGSLLRWEDDVDVSVMLDVDDVWRTLADGISARASAEGYFVDTFEDKGLIAVSHETPLPAPLRWENYRLRGEIRLDLTAYRPAMSWGEPVLERTSPKGDMPPTQNGNYGVARNLVLPTSTIQFLGRDCACPNRPDEYLGALYGDFNKVAYTYVDAGPAAARRDLDMTG